MQLISEAGSAKIAKAISKAESKTSGEIVAVVAGESDSYHYIPLLWAALAALAVPLPLIYGSGLSMTVIYAAQVTLFALLAGIVQWWPLRIRLIPRAVKHARAHRNAVEQFLAQNMHTTESRTGVLIFVSIVEHYAEVIADDGIYQKVPPQV